MARGALKHLLIELRWSVMLIHTQQFSNPSSNPSIVKIFNFCGLDTKANIAQLPIEAQISIILRYQQTELTSRPNVNILALLDKVNGSKYEKTPNRLSVKGLTNYTSKLITAAEKLTYEEYKFLYM